MLMLTNVVVIAPGLWYIVGVAVRLAVDLGLHSEDSLDNDEKFQKRPESGQRQWMRDLRRRLWWSVYSFDRLVR